MSIGQLYRKVAFDINCCVVQVLISSLALVRVSQRTAFLYMALCFLERTYLA